MAIGEQGCDVLLCCDQIDLDVVRPYMLHLHSLGIDARTLVDNLGGAEREFEMRQRLTEARLVLVFLSKKTVNKEGPLQRAILEAVDRAKEKPPGRIFIIPVRLDDCETHVRLAPLQRIDVFDNIGWRKLSDQVLRRCKPKPASHKRSEAPSVRSAARRMRAPFVAADPAATGEVPLMTFPKDMREFIYHCVPRRTWKQLDLETRRIITTMGCKLEPIIQVVPRTPTNLVVGFECLALGAMGENFAEICKRCAQFDQGLLRILLAVAASKSISHMRRDSMKRGNEGVNNLFYTINLDPLMVEHAHFETFLNWHHFDIAHNVIFEINETTTASSLERIKVLQVEFDLRYAADDINAWHPDVRAALIHRVEMTKLDYNAVASAMSARSDDPFETIFLLHQHKVDDKPLVLEGIGKSHVRFLERYWEYPRQGTLFGQGHEIECGPPWESAVSSLKTFGGPGGGFIRKRKR